ncbi:minor tail protein [Mycobacterium phage Phantastic]|uniref:Minor tail protein n=1 Tax=Mycobacterium phage Phantastic TaxID=1486426 RepID=A0A023W6W9_9CAUD|nr:minor tail protein [Mycobacterium phage Phantastic]AHY27094.1 minor tail protein [Mycobacterium phage Phantastic]
MVDTPNPNPNNGPGAELEKWLGTGAFELGGGDWNYGQDFTEDAIRSLFELPAITLINAIELLEEQLLKMPIEALRVFKPLIPDAIEDDFEDVATAVAKIIDTLTDGPAALLRGEFDEWLSETFGPLAATVQQVLEILAGLVVDPVNETVGAIKDWWDLITGKTQGLNSSGQLDASKLTNLENIGEIPNGLEKMPDLQSLVDAATNALSGASQVGEEVVGAGLDIAKSTMENLFSTLSKVTRDVQALQSEQEASQVGGRRFNVDFTQYPDGPFPSGLFNVTYSGAGSSTLGISGGKAIWNTVNDGYRRATLIFPEPTLTPFQVVRGTLSSPPEQGTNVRIWSVARANASGTDFVFARGYCNGFLSYRGDIGCYKDGVEYVWASNVPLTWSLDIRIICGVGNDPRHHIVLSGDKMIIDLYEPADKQSRVDEDHCYWGAISETNGVQVPGNVAGASVVDNAPPAVVGTTLRVSKRSGGDITIPSGGAKLPNNFYETIDYQSPDLIYEPSKNCRVTATKAGTYLVEYRVYHGQYATNTGGHAQIYRNGSVYAKGQWGSCPFVAGWGIMVDPTDSTHGSFLVPLNPGDYIEPGFWFSANMSNTGDARLMAGGAQSYMSVARLGTN